MASIVFSKFFKPVAIRCDDKLIPAFVFAHPLVHVFKGIAKTVASVSAFANTSLVSCFAAQTIEREQA